MWFCSQWGIIYAWFYVALFNYVHFKNASALPIYMQYMLLLEGFVAKYPSSETLFIPLEMNLKIVYKSFSLKL